MIRILNNLAERKNQRSKIRKIALQAFQGAILELTSEEENPKIIAKDRGELWHKIDNAKNLVRYEDTGFFDYLEEIEKLLLELVSLTTKIVSQNLHQKPCTKLKDERKDLVTILNKILKIENSNLRSIEMELFKYTEKLDKRVLRVK